MPAFTRILAASFAFLIATGAAHAQLVFAKDRVAHDATATEHQYEAEFPFVNEGQSTVTIEDIRSTCGCTVPELEKMEYAPGESGVVRAVFTYGQRTGRQQKTITVRTSEGVHRLVLEVLIPQKWSVEPRIQTWRRNGEADAKAVTIRFEAVSPTEVSLASFPQDRFEAETQWDAASRTFTINFTPRDLGVDGVSRAHVKAQTEQGIVDIPVYLRVY